MTNDAPSPAWTTIESYFHPTEAHIAAGRLESEGVPVFLLGINHASANWIIANALGGIQLQVPADCVEEARTILADPVEAPDEGPSCPACGSTETSPMTNGRKAALLAVHLLNLPLPWDHDRRHCDACGKEWTLPRPIDKGP